MGSRPLPKRLKLQRRRPLAHDDESRSVGVLEEVESQTRVMQALKRTALPGTNQRTAGHVCVYRNGPVEGRGLELEPAVAIVGSRPLDCRARRACETRNL